MLAVRGDSTEEEDEIEEEEAAVAPMAKSDSESDEEPLDSLALLKEKVSGLAKQILLNYFSLQWMSMNRLILKIAC